MKTPTNEEYEAARQKKLDERDSIRTVAQGLNKANKQFQFALDALWDAREQGNESDFTFYQQAVIRYSLSIVEWTKKLSIKKEVK